jgi:hypothetical protein
MSDLRVIRAFSTELMKIAADIKDADIRSLLAHRRGEEYLEGGRLPSNADIGLQKQAAGGYTAPVGLSASGSYDLKANKKKSNSYQKARDYSTTAMKGGLTGLGILGASNAMRGRFGSPSVGLETLRAARQARRAATVGASAAVVDRAYRHDELNKQAMVAPTVGAAFRSPQQELARGQEVGRFESGAHAYGRAPKTVQIGRKFRLP